MKYFKLILSLLGSMILSIISTAIVTVLVCLIVWPLWNWIMPIVFNLPTISLVQSYGLTFLMGILFKAFVTVPVGSTKHYDDLY